MSGEQKIPENGIEIPFELDKLWEPVAANKTLLTGTEKFGMSGPDSNVDIVVRYADVLKLAPVSVWSKIGALNEGYGRCIAVPLYKWSFDHNRMINLIVVDNDNEFDEWVWATARFRMLLANCKISKQLYKHRPSRINMFQLLRAQFQQARYHKIV